MKKQKIFSRVALILSVIMLTTSFAGCGKSTEKNTSEENTSVQASTEAGSTQAEKQEPMDIKIFRTGFTLVNQQPIVDKLGELTNTKPVFLESSWDNMMEKIALMVTSGDDVDWINVDASQPYNQWGQDGLLVDLAPILKEHKDELKVLNSIAFSDLFKGYRGPNGEVYGIPAVAFVQNNGLSIRKDWLDQAGLTAPDTLDGVYNTLKTFKDKNIGGKGAIPLVTGSGDKLYTNYAFGWVFDAFEGDGNTGGNHFYKEGDGYKPFDISDGNKEALKYIRKLQQDGLVNADWPTATSQKYTDTFKAGKAGLVYGSNPFAEDVYKNDANARVTWLDAPKGPSGKQSYGGTSPMWLLNTITKNCKDPYRVLQLIEYMHSKEARELLSFGLEGVTYEKNDKGEYDTSKYVDKNKEVFGEGGSQLLWGYVNAYTGYLDVDKYPNALDAIKNMQMFNLVKKQPVDNDYSGWVAHIGKFANPYPYAAYAIDEMKTVQTTVTEYVDGFYVKAIVTKNFDIEKEWPKFVEGYYKNGGQKAIDIFTKYAKEHNLN